MNERLHSLLSCLPDDMHRSILQIDDKVLNRLEEIRIRVSGPVALLTDQREIFLKRSLDHTLYIPDMTEMKEILERVTKSSVYAYLEDIRNGFITVEGGHRIGIGGQAVMKNDSITHMKEIGFFNIRIAGEKKGISDALYPQLIEGDTFQNTLIVSPPQAGKTTLLRDITRNVSNHLQKGKITLIDERGEIAAVYRGIPQNDVGIRTDVLTGIPKWEGIFLAIRSLSPTVIVTDELGSSKEVEAVFTALHSGVKLITTVHGRDEQELMHRADLRPLFQYHVFRKIIVLDAGCKGRIAKIIDGGEFG